MSVYVYVDLLNYGSTSHTFWRIGIWLYVYAFKLQIKSILDIFTSMLKYQTMVEFTLIPMRRSTNECLV
jgi:hypothetical protein